MKVMTINLHTYQEIDLKQFNNLYDFFNEYKIINDKIVEAIKDNDVDIIYFQEAAQHKDMPITMKIGNIDIKKHNVVLDISDSLKEKYNLDYNFVWDWSHYGWNIWEEGVAILSKHTITNWDSRYVSVKKDINNINSRKVINAKIKINNFIEINTYSAHLNWWNSGFKDDIDNLFKWVENHNKENEFIICGDFNNEAGSLGYDYFMSKTINNYNIQDVYYEVNNNGFYDATIRGDAFNDTSRIDFILKKANRNMIVTYSKILFNDDDCYGRVSDHMGILAEFKLV